MERKDVDFVDILMEEEKEEKEWTNIVYIASTQPTFAKLAPEGVPTARNVKTEDGSWTKEAYTLDTSYKSLLVLGHAHLIWADVVEDKGVNVYVGKEFAFAIKGKPKLVASVGGYTLELSGFSKKSVLYDPIEGEAVERIGIVSHVYATDGKELYVVEVRRGRVAGFGAYTATMSAEAKQVWDAYRAYVNTLREPSKERIDAMFKAFAPFPQLIQVAEECFSQGVGGANFDNVRFLDKDALKEKVGPVLREMAKENHRKWLVENLSEKDLFAVLSDGRAILRTGGMLTGEIAVLDAEPIVAMSIGTTIVPMQDGVRPGVALLNVVAVREDKCNGYFNRYPRKVLAIARGKGAVSSGKADAFLTRISPEEYKRVYEELRSQNRVPVSPAGAVPKVEELSFQVPEKVMELAKLYGDALGGFIPVDEQVRKKGLERLPTVGNDLADKRREADERKELEEVLMQEIVAELEEEEKPQRRRTSR